MTLFKMVSFHFHWLFVPLRGFSRSKTLGYTINNLKFYSPDPFPSSPPPSPRLWGTRLWGQSLATSSSLFFIFFSLATSFRLSFFIFAAGILATPGTEQRARQFPRVEDLAHCHRKQHWGQKAYADIEASSEKGLVCCPVGHCKSSQLWLNIHTLGA